MSFTGLHRALGANPGPLTSEMVDQAVAAGIAEADDLDWKRDLPPERNLNQTDFPKDVAAMANNGGGVIVYGVEAIEKAASQRVNVGTLSETHERALRTVAVTAISPPVFGLDVIGLGDEGARVVAVVVPGSVEVPHLIYRGEYFGAPVRNDADTVWMRERQVETMYRARFTEQRNAHEALDALYTSTAAGRDTAERAWFVGVARPRVPVALPARLTRDQARALAESSCGLALVFVGHGAIHPLENVDRLNPRPGLRSWVLPSNSESQATRWREAWVSIHDDGAATVTAAIGGHRTTSGDYASGDVVATSALESAVADLLAIVGKVSSHLTADDYDVRFGVEWAGEAPLTFEGHSGWGGYTAATLAAYAPVSATIQTSAGADDFYDATYGLVCDAVNQAGVHEPRMMSERTADGESPGPS